MSEETTKDRRYRKLTAKDSGRFIATNSRTGEVIGDYYEGEDHCRICIRYRGIRVIIFDSYVNGRASSFICEKCLEKIQK